MTENTILFAQNYFKEELKEFYNTPELTQLLQITFAHYFNLSRVDLTLKTNNQLSEADFDVIVNIVDELKKHKPLAYIIGEWEFYGLKLTVNEHTLIPRSETEELVQLIINDNEGKESLSILDIGTGSGCIPLALKKSLPNAHVTAWDVSEEALKVASANGQLNELAIIFNTVDILNWEFQNEDEKYDVIVSNPPYITHKEKKLMHKNVLDYEPHIALFVDNEDPLLFYRTIADFALNHLNGKGKLYFEINEKLGIEVERLLRDKKFKNINIVKDINEKDRIVSCNID